MNQLFMPSTNPPTVGLNNSNSHRQRYHSLQYSLLYDFHCIFSKGRSIAQNIQGGSLRMEGAALLSKRYRMAIKRCIKMLEQAEHNQQQGEAPSQTVNIQQLGEELCSFGLLWSLIEAITFRPSHNLIVIDLIEWVRENFLSTQSLVPSAKEGRMGETSFLGSIMEELMQQERPENHESYWNAVIRQVLCADFPSVVTLLQFHSAFKTDEVLSKMVKCLQSANSALFKHGDRSSCEEFLSIQKKIRDMATQKQLFRLHDNLGVICSLLIGDRGTFKKYFDLFRPNWFEVFPAFMLYFYPTSGGAQMPKVVEHFFNLIGINNSRLSQLERTIRCIIELDLIQALRLICAGGQSACWFATHLIDLLHFHDPNFLNPVSTTKLFDEPSGRELAHLDLRSRLLVEYAQLLFQDNQLWEIAPDYLGASGMEGATEMMDQLVGQINWNGNISMAQRLLAICDQFELETAREDLLRSLTLNFCRQGEWGCALGWALRMRSKELTIQVARRILQGAIPADRIGQMRIFEQLAEQFVDCAELALLYKFHSFKRHLLGGEMRTAVQCLQELFVDNSSPTEFHAVLFEEMVRILASFQQPLVGLDALEDPTDDVTLPGLDRESIQDMFRAMSMFQQQQELINKRRVELEGEGQTTKERGALFPPRTVSGREVSEQIADLMQTLRPMLAQALATCSLN